MPEALSKRDAFLLGFKEASTTYLGVVSFGLVTGVSTKAVGFSSAESIVMSVFLFSGTAQLASVQLFAEGASLFLIWLTALLVNFRYIMYSATLLPYLKNFSLARRALLSFLMLDQSFAFGLNRFQDNPNMSYKDWYYLGISGPTLFVWSSACITGVLIGAQIPQGLSLEFSLPLIFLALTAMTIKSQPGLVAALVGGTTAALLAGLPNGVGLLIATVLAVGAALLSERWLKVKA